MLKPAAQNHGSLNQITTIGEQRIGRSALLRCHHVKKTVNEGAVTHVCDASFYPVRDAQSPPQPSFAPPVQGRPDAGPRRCGGDARGEAAANPAPAFQQRSEEHTSDIQSLMRTSY